MRAGATPLILAVNKQKEDVVHYLAELANASLDIRDDSGRTALHTAVELNAKGIVEILVQAGADINQR